MLASEYSVRWPVGSSSNASIRRVKESISAGVAWVAAMRAAMLSIAAQTVIISTISRLSCARRRCRDAGSADEALLLQDRQRFADWGAADAEVFAELPLVQADFLGLTVDVHFGDGALDRVAGLLSQAEPDVERFDP